MSDPDVAPMANIDDAIVVVRNVTKTYRSTAVPVHALRGVNLTVKRGEFVGAMGESGSGKSTLLHILGGLLTPTEGDVVIDGRELSKADDRERTEIRRRLIGFVFQRFNLFPTLTVTGNLKLAARIYGNGRPVDTEFLDEVLDELGLGNKTGHRPNELSGGEQQRVAIARAVMHRPALLLADEPTGNLDSANSARVIAMLQRMNEKWGQTILMITHSEKAAACTERVLRMSDGRILPTASYARSESG